MKKLLVLSSFFLIAAAVWLFGGEEKTASPPAEVVTTVVTPEGVVHVVVRNPLDPPIVELPAEAGPLEGPAYYYGTVDHGTKE